MTPEFTDKLLSINNFAIFDGYAKAQAVIQKHNTALCSISGGSDSDIVLDIIHNVDESGKVTYCWYDTGLEYQATKEHLEFLEKKYGINIHRIKAVKPIPQCVKQYGVPFLSKYVSEQMMRLQKHGFQWEDEPYEILIQKYERCSSALKWWCSIYDTCPDGRIIPSKFSINRNRFLKEFIMQDPPDFPISNKCCEYAKKKTAKQTIDNFDADLDITGIRKAEGGIRSAAFKTCFSECKSKGCDTFRLIFWYTDKDKNDYEQMFDIQHSRCYTEYGLKRTGCVGCPFSKHINEELAVIEKYEPNLYKAAMHLFGKSYEYTAKYRAFAKEMKAKEKEEKKRAELSAGNSDISNDSRWLIGVPYLIEKTLIKAEGGEGNGKCIIEFIYDDDYLPPCVAFSGSWGYYNWCGLDLGANIKSIKKINYGDPVEY